MSKLRAVATVTYYVFGDTKQELDAEAKKIASEIEQKYDNSASVEKVELMNFGQRCPSAMHELDSAIERAKPNMDKIKNVDEFLKETRGYEVEIGCPFDEDLYSKK